MKKTFAPIYLIALFFAYQVHAQDILNAELNATPTAINPAFTGMFNGTVRVNTLYNNEWSGLFVPYNVIGAAIDLPIYTTHEGSYFATGLQMTRISAGDAAQGGFNALGSLAYHQFFKKRQDSNGCRSSDLAIGLQAGTIQTNMDLYYLSSGFPYYNPAALLYWEGLTTNYFQTNIGIAFSHVYGPHFSYTMGAAVYNITQPAISNLPQRSRIGTDPIYILEIGADWVLTKKFSLRPQVLYQNRPYIYSIIAGNDFQYSITSPGKKSAPVSLFMGIYYKTKDIITFSAGTEFGRCKVGIAYDHDYSSFRTRYFNGYEGLKITFRYVAPGKKHGSQIRTVPCSRF